MSLPGPEAIALLSALGGGVLVKIADFFIQRSGKRLDEGSLIRKELREEIKEYRREVESGEIRIGEWQSKYYELLVKCNTEKVLFLAEIERLKSENKAAD